MFGKICFLFILISTVLSKEGQYRKHYGLSYHVKCRNYVKTFKCMTNCKSMGYQVYRMTNNCRCSCHEMKSTTLLPNFKWRTNGTTRAVPKTRSAELYHIVGPLIDPYKTDPPTPTTENVAICPPVGTNTSTTEATTTNGTTKTGPTTTIGATGSIEAGPNTTSDATGPTEAVPTTTIGATGPTDAGPNTTSGATGPAETGTNTTSGASSLTETGPTTTAGTTKT